MAPMNQVALQRLLRKKTPITAQLRADVPLSTLIRHAKGKKPPSTDWLAFYEETLGWSWRGWFTPAQHKAVAKKGQKLRELVQEEQMRAKPEAKTFFLTDKGAVSLLRQKAIAIEDEARRCGLIAHYIGDYGAAYPVPHSEYWNVYCVNTINSHNEVKISLNGRQRNIRERDLDTLLDALRALQNGDKVGAVALLWVPS